MHPVKPPLARLMILKMAAALVVKFDALSQRLRALIDEEQWIRRHRNLGGT
jgi:hypothetical protein